jgi:hypothetical protein
MAKAKIEHTTHPFERAHGASRRENERREARGEDRREDEGDDRRDS